jgi:hypothetical protein
MKTTFRFVAGGIAAAAIATGAAFSGSAAHAFAQ